MRSSVHVRIRQAAISAVSVATLIASLALIDERVRNEGTQLAATGVVSATSHADAVQSRLLAAVRDLEAEQLSLAAFVVIATGLVIAMLRT